MRNIFVRLGWGWGPYSTPSVSYRPEVVVDSGPDEWADEGRVLDVIEYGPWLGDAALPADVRAARWAAARGLPYRG